MTTRIIRFVAQLALASLLPVYGHHSFAAEFDASKPVTVTGSVEKIVWMNPHATLYLNVKDARWEFELASPNALLRLGWTRASLQPGDVITVKGFRAKNGARWAQAEAVTVSDGRQLLNLRR